MSAWWDDDHVLLLITPDEFEDIAPGTALTCIDDTVAVKGRDPIDMETRAGHLAYGVTGDHPLRLQMLHIMKEKRNAPR